MPIAPMRSNPTRPNIRSCFERLLITDTTSTPCFRSSANCYPSPATVTKGCAPRA
jgi:hypothetical protein